MQTSASGAQTAPSPGWKAVDFLVQFSTRQKRLGLLSETASWFASVAFFRRAESETMYLAEPSAADRRYHKTILAALIAQGERLLTAVEEAGGLPENLDEIKPVDLDATIEELRNTQAQWYGDMTASRRAQILKEIFDVPPG